MYMGTTFQASAINVYPDLAYSTYNDLKIPTPPRQEIKTAHHTPPTYTSHPFQLFSPFILLLQSPTQKPPCLTPHPKFHVPLYNPPPSPPPHFHPHHDPQNPPLQSDSPPPSHDGKSPELTLQHLPPLIPTHCQQGNVVCAYPVFLFPA
ncbi:hypothetical protein T440DRAFT_50416 [Plenodomus tracheiphilus IPT5]|uniref:Uncharacterized protein n=1 Tax=Plenodomus tracheiphilus IPT5 TaxID=1408161 RepID=A0A6A7B9K7_9PLEO|nr:hypothetical protein T440DRAFT_50416 [Plenodomus tracheiphilus IPT5]